MARIAGLGVVVIPERFCCMVAARRYPDYGAKRISERRQAAACVAHAHAPCWLLLSAGKVSRARLHSARTCAPTKLAIISLSEMMREGTEVELRRLLQWFNAKRIVLCR